MSKTAVQTAVCDICGADVRKGSLFCYNCGGSLTQTVDERPGVLPPEAITSVPAKNGAGKEKSAGRREPRKRRSVERGPVEVIWEPREGLSWPFVIVSIVLFFMALVLFSIAMWMK